MPTDTKKKRDSDTDVTDLEALWKGIERLFQQARAGNEIRRHTAEGEVHAEGSAMPTGVKRKRDSGKKVAEGASSGANMEEPQRRRPAGLVFFCNNTAIRDECLRHNVIAVPERLKVVVEEVKRGMPLFLYDKECLHGVFKASSDYGMNLVPEAFASFDEKRPAQVRFEIEQKDAYASLTKCALVEDAVTTASMRLSNEQVAMLKGNFKLKTGEDNFDGEGARLSARDFGAGLTAATGDPRLSARDQNEPVDTSLSARGGHDVAATVPSAEGDPMNTSGRDDELLLAAKISADALRGGHVAATVPSAEAGIVNASDDVDEPVAARGGRAAERGGVRTRGGNNAAARGRGHVAATVPSAEVVNASDDVDEPVAAKGGRATPRGGVRTRGGTNSAARGRGHAAPRGGVRTRGGTKSAARARGHAAATAPSEEAGPLNASDDHEPVAGRGGRARGGSAAGRGGHVMAVTAASAEADESDDDEPVAATIRGEHAPARGRRAPRAPPLPRNRRFSPPRDWQRLPIQSSRPPVDYQPNSLPYYQPPNQPAPDPHFFHNQPPNYQPPNPYYEPLDPHYFHGIHDSVNARASAGSRTSPVPPTNYQPPNYQPYYFHGINDSVNFRASAGSRPPVPPTNYPPPRPPRPPPPQEPVDLSLSLAFPSRQNIYDRR
ncbi:hypothetical protein L7F22_028753 [Adiantum nelumboides]|nr:hypothetical protein [Adiantum nelumboides]